MSVIVLVACCLGFIRVSVEEPSSEYFTAINSKSREDLRHAAQFFPLLEARKEQIIMIPKRGQNILSEDCLNDAVLVHQTVVNISGYENLCFRQLPSSSTKDDCVISSPLQLAGARFEHLSNLSSILDRELTNPITVLTTGQTFRYSFKEMLSGFQVKKDPLTVQANALRVIYFIRKATNEDEDQKVLSFEAYFESSISSMTNRLKCASLSFRTGKTTTDALQSVLQPEIMPLYLSVLITVILVFVVIYLSFFNLSCLKTVSPILLSILLPLTSAAGLISMANISLSPTALFVPFLLLGKATSDVVFILGEWKRQKNVLSLEHRASSCVARAGILQVVSAVCGTILFGIAIKSSFEVISTFFLVTLVAFILVSIASFIVTMTLLLVLKKHSMMFNTCSWSSSFSNAKSFGRRSSFSNATSFGRRSSLSNATSFGRRSSLSNATSFGEKPTDKLESKLQSFLTRVSKTQISLGGRVISFLLLACIITLCVLSALQSGERTSTASMFYQTGNFNQFNEAQEQFFGNETDVSIVFSGKADYSQQKLQDQVASICKKLGEASYSQEEPACWMVALQLWAKRQNISCSSPEFHQCLNMFLNQSSSIPFRQDVRFENNKARSQILASRVHVQMVLHSSFKEDRRTLEKLRNDLPNESLLKAAPVSEAFPSLDDLFLLERETVIVLAIATVVVFVLCLFSSSFIRMSTYITVTFILLVLETAAIMKAFEVTLNQITFICLFFTVVLSLNFSLQVAHSFVFSEHEDVGQRMNKALYSVGWPVLIAALLQITGSISLGFIYPSLQDIFFPLVPLVSVLGLIHALVIFPPIITLLFELMVRFDSPSEIYKRHSTKKRKKGMALQEMNGDVSQVKPKRPGISIVGIACRFPGANSKDMFWDLLQQGKSSIGAFPRNREEQHQTFFELYHPKRFVSGRLCAVNGSYLEDIANFDNRFFGISNQEARGMDPQQRILLEVVYEAIEDAGMRLEDLQRCKTGVFVGVMNLEYGALITDPSNYNNIDQFSSTGMTASILANRVSFCLNLTGPSFAVDTACSSSLTALKLACDNLHNEDCEIAIVCAPNIVLNHAMQMVSSIAGLLAPDGRCKSFDASGDGYGRGEGFAAVILKLAHAASSDKDDEYCEIIACGMNNDGQNAVPMTAPSSKTQAELCRTVLEHSGLSPQDIGYFEAHGTGTAIGDVIEVTSIADAYTRGTTDTTRKLRIGSVKSNLNHTESTSGLAGIIKVALMIKNKRFVPTVNVHVLNPKLKLEEKGLFVQQTNEPWKTENGKPRVGAVNSFGYGGSNVHAILREVTTKQSLDEENVQHLNHVLTLSARSQDALKRMAGLYSKWLNDSAQDMDSTFVENLCYSLNERRSQFQHRLALPFGSISEASKSLADFAGDSNGWEKVVSYGEVKFSNPKIVFMFGGQGSQWYAMGRQLFETEPVFKEAVLAVNNLVRDSGKTWSLIDELMATEDESRIAENSIAQPATFAVQYATAQLLMSWRIYPSAVLGHSLGEFAAACVAGIITLKEAVQLVLTRSTLQDQCPSNGGMAALGMSEEEARRLLMDLRLSATLSIAAVNDAKSVTVSGDSQSVEALGQYLANHAKETFWRVLGTKRAFHSSHMEVIKKPFQAAMRRVKLNPQLSKIPMYSTVEGEVISGEQFDRDYWWRNIRCPVQFQPALKHLLRDGYKQIIEISTQPILAHYVKQIAVQEKLQDQAAPGVLATLPRKRVPVSDQDKSFLLNTVCKLYTLGFPVDWTSVQRNPSAKFVRSLNYPWLESSFWYRERPPQGIIPLLGTDKNTESKTHPFLGKVKITELYSGLHCWETEIDLHRFPNLKDHALIQGGTVMPGATYLEMAFAMVKDLFVDVAGLELTDVKLSSLLTLPETQVTNLQCTNLDELFSHIIK